MSQSGGQDWKKAAGAISRIVVTGGENNSLVTIEGVADGFQCIGIGTDAAVFVHEHAPGYAYKIYSPQAAQKKRAE